ncbi:MAG: hypothetical protein QXN39_02635, partial [Archaeoglobaceae archaeon]
TIFSDVISTILTFLEKLLSMRSFKAYQLFASLVWISSILRNFYPRFSEYYRVFSFSHNLVAQLVNINAEQVKVDEF